MGERLEQLGLHDIGYHLVFDRRSLVYSVMMVTTITISLC
jgi:hypothetical protein